MFDINSMKNVKPKVSKCENVESVNDAVKQRESVKVSDKASNDSKVHEHQRHLSLKTFANSMDRSEEDLLVNDCGVKLGFKNGGKKMNSNSNTQNEILSPKLNVRMKRPQTPKGRKGLDLGSQSRFKSVRAMFLRLESCNKLAISEPLAPMNSEKIGEYDHLKFKSEKCIEENVASNSLSRTLMVRKSPLKKGEIACPDSLVHNNSKIGVHLSQNLRKNESQDPPNSMLSPNFKKSGAKTSFVERLLPGQYMLSPSTKPKEGDKISLNESSWKSAGKHHWIEPKLDRIEKKKSSKRNAFKIRGRNSQQSTLKDFWNNEQAPTEIARNLVGKQTNQSEIGKG